MDWKWRVHQSSLLAAIMIQHVVDSYAADGVGGFPNGRGTDCPSPCRVIDVEKPSDIQLKCLAACWDVFRMPSLGIAGTFTCTQGYHSCLVCKFKWLHLCSCSGLLAFWRVLFVCASNSFSFGCGCILALWVWSFVQSRSGIGNAGWPVDGSGSLPGYALGMVI